MSELLSYTVESHKILLTENESKLFEVLLASVKWHSSRVPSVIGEETILRVAGGWVRDKILRRESHDIDIALNNRSGVEFANSVNEYLSHMGQQTRTIAVIQANPDQSKHLETANLRVLGFEIDCVNLRAETYTEESRIPQISFGSPLEDALRRDFTINSLFYNLNTGLVEDYTGQGLTDMERGIIRTPLSAHVTFKDDPLRVLRAIRFSSRLNFSLDEDLVSAAGSQEIIAALHCKVSRERVYRELEGMMVTAQSRPVVAFSLMYRLNILDSVFLVDTLWANFNSTTSAAAGSLPSSSWQCESMSTVVWLNALLSLNQQSLQPIGSGLNYHSTSALLDTVPVEWLCVPKHGGYTKALFLAAALAGVRQLKVTEKKKEVPFVSVILRDSLKIDTNSLRDVQTLVDGIQGFMDLLSGSSGAGVSVDSAGSLLRTSKDLWRDCLVLACAYSISQLVGTPSVIQHIAPHSGGPVVLPLSVSIEAKEIILRYSRLQQDILALQLDNVWLLKPLLDGSQLIEMLGLKKGPAVGLVMEEQVKWQIRTRSTDVEECVKYLLESNCAK